MSDGGETEALGHTHNKIVTADKWMHVAITFNGEVEKPRFQMYVNGKKMARSMIEYPVIRKLTGTRLQIGAALGRLGVGGAVDELRIYDRELSHDEVKTVMSYGQ